MKRSAPRVPGSLAAASPGRRNVERQTPLEQSQREGRSPQVTITHLLNKIPYERAKPRKIKLPTRQNHSGYREPELPLRYVQERF